MDGPTVDAALSPSAVALYGIWAQYADRDSQLLRESNVEGPA
jgi:hypothetical protein